MSTWRQQGSQQPAVAAQMWAEGMPGRQARCIMTGHAPTRRAVPAHLAAACCLAFSKVASICTHGGWAWARVSHAVKASVPWWGRGGSDGVQWKWAGLWASNGCPRGGGCRGSGPGWARCAEQAQSGHQLRSGRATVLMARASGCPDPAAHDCEGELGAKVRSHLACSMLRQCAVQQQAGLGGRVSGRASGQVGGRDGWAPAAA